MDWMSLTMFDQHEADGKVFGFNSFCRFVDMEIQPESSMHQKKRGFLCTVMKVNRNKLQMMVVP